SSAGQGVIILNNYSSDTNCSGGITYTNNTFTWGGYVGFVPYGSIGLITLTNSLWINSSNFADITGDMGAGRFNSFTHICNNITRATIIEPSTIRTNFVSNFFWASGADDQSFDQNFLWWKWTPSYSAVVRCKAVLNQSGVPLEIFVECDESNNLHRIADNND